MNYKLKLADGTTQLIKITKDIFKKWKVWKVEFADGKVAMLFKSGNEWMQRTEDALDLYLLNTIGSYIDGIVADKNNLAL